MGPVQSNPQWKWRPWPFLEQKPRLGPETPPSALPEQGRCLNLNSTYFIFKRNSSLSHRPRCGGIRLFAARFPGLANPRRGMSYSASGSHCQHKAETFLFRGELTANGSSLPCIALADIFFAHLAIYLERSTAVNMTEVRERSRRMGIVGAVKLRKGDAIRAIQKQEGNQACFGASWRFDCRQLDCCWRQDCLTKNPG